jgi:hypothetical protein
MRYCQTPTKLRNVKKKEVPGKIHKVYFPILQTSSPTNLVFLMLYLGNVNSQPNVNTQQFPA